MSDKPTKGGTEGLFVRLKQFCRQRTFERHSLLLARIGGETVGFWRGAPVPMSRAIALAKHPTVAVVVIVPEEMIFSQFVEVPAKVLDGLREMLPLHLKRWSPFPPGAMVAAANVVGRGSSVGTVEVRYCSPQLAQDLILDRPGHRIVADAIALGSGSEWLVELRHRVFRLHDARRLGEGMLLGIAIGLSAFLMGRTFNALDSQRLRLERQTAEISRAILEDQTMEKRIGVFEAAGRLLAEAPPRGRPISNLLASLSDWIPAEGRLAALDFDDAGFLSVSLHTAPDLAPKVPPVLDGWRFVDSSTTNLSAGFGNNPGTPMKGSTFRFNRATP